MTRAPATYPDEPEPVRRTVSWRHHGSTTWVSTDLPPGSTVTITSTSVVLPLVNITWERR